jgi:hypothetical protein
MAVTFRVQNKFLHFDVLSYGNIAQHRGVQDLILHQHPIIFKLSRIAHLLLNLDLDSSKNSLMDIWSKISVVLVFHKGMCLGILREVDRDEAVDILEDINQYFKNVVEFSTDRQVNIAHFDHFHLKILKETISFKTAFRHGSSS